MPNVKSDLLKLDPRLTCVATQYKVLQRELSDAEWNNDPRAKLIRTEFMRFEALIQQGVMYEPNF